MASDWEEIKRLAADFQKVQLSSSLQRLSERNCVEVVQLLIEKGLLDIIYTTDGKEYLTPDHLKNEIKDEMYVRGGRVNLVDLAKTLNVDFEKVSKVANEIPKEEKNVKFILGQLIDNQYLQRIAAEINDKLSQSGEINVADLTIQYDLPADFLMQNVMLRHLNSIIMGKQDTSNPKLFFTQAYVARSKAKIRGALAAITKPTPVSAILSQSGVAERLFFLSVNEFTNLGTITSKSVNALYIPHIYTRTQIEWVQNFYKQNGYLEQDSLTGLGIPDPKQFIEKHIPNEKFTHLKKCSIGEKLVDQVVASLDECISSNSYLDVSTVLPSSISDEDIHQLIDLILIPAKRKQTMIFGSIILASKFLDDIVKPCYDIANENAKKSVQSGSYQQYMAEKMMKHQDLAPAEVESKVDKRDERRKKAAGGKAGGGAQGRETKTKSTKKNVRGQRGNVSDSDDDMQVNKKKGDNKEINLELITIKEIVKILEKGLEPEGLEDLSKQLGNHYLGLLNKTALQKAHELYEISLQQSNQSRKQTHASLQDKLNNLLNDIRLYEKGLKLLSTDQQPQLIKYLLKSFGTDFCNEIFLYVSGECNLNYNSAALTADQRNKLITECDQEYKASLQSLNKSLNGAIVDDFLLAAENALQSCSMILKKIDKKKDRNIILCHKHELLEQLNNCNDPALILHLAVLIVFTVATQNMVHASGRHVSAILAFLKTYLNDDQSRLLTNYHDLVLKFLSTDDAVSKEEIGKQLEELYNPVKEVAGNFKKAGVPVD